MQLDVDIDSNYFEITKITILCALYVRQLSTDNTKTLAFIRNFIVFALRFNYYFENHLIANNVCVESEQTRYKWILLKWIFVVFIYLLRTKIKTHSILIVYYEIILNGDTQIFTLFRSFCFVCNFVCLDDCVMFVHETTQWLVLIEL